MNAKGTSRKEKMMSHRQADRIVELCDKIDEWYYQLLASFMRERYGRTQKKKDYDFQQFANEGDAIRKVSEQLGRALAHWNDDSDGPAEYDDEKNILKCAICESLIIFADRISKSARARKFYRSDAIYDTMLLDFSGFMFSHSRRRLKENRITGRKGKENEEFKIKIWKRIEARLSNPRDINLKKILRDVVSKSRIKWIRDWYQEYRRKQIITEFTSRYLKNNHDRNDELFSICIKTNKNPTKLSSEASNRLFTELMKHKEFIEFYNKRKFSSEYRVNFIRQLKRRVWPGKSYKEIIADYLSQHKSDSSL